MAAIYVVSDLHLGDGSIRDNFAYHNKKERFMAFLNAVEKEREAELLVLGDCFELWQAYAGAVFNANRDTIDRLAAMPRTWAVFGNHDGEFAPSHSGGKSGAAEWLRHEWFRTRTLGKIDRDIGGKRFTFAHGHEGDAFNDGDRPLSGNALAIFAGILEDRLGSRYLDPEGKIPLEAVLTEFGDMLLGFLHRLGDSLASKKERGGAREASEPEMRVEMIMRDIADRGIQDKAAALDSMREFVADEFRDYAKKDNGTGERGLLDAAKGMGLWLLRLTGGVQREESELLRRHFQAMRTLRDTRKADVVVCGHTHIPGRIGEWYFNSGSWSDAGSDALRIDESGRVALLRCVLEGGKCRLEEVPWRDFPFGG